MSKVKLLPSIAMASAVVTSIIVLQGCAKLAATSASPLTAAAAFASVQTNIAKLDSLLPDQTDAATTSRVSLDSSAISHAPSGQAMSSFSSDWNITQVFSHPKCSGSGPHCSGSITPREWMSYQIDPQAVRDNGSSINIFGRLKNALMIGCAVALAIPTGSDGLLAVGTHTIAFTAGSQFVANIVSLCGMSSEEAASMSDAGATISAVVTATTDTTLYDRKIVFTLDESMGGGTQSFLMRTSISEVNIATSEVKATQASRTLMSIKDGKTKVEYISQNIASGGSHEFGRLFVDDTADEGAILYSMGGSAGSYIRYTLVGKPTAGGTVALSIDTNGFGGFVGNFDHAACINTTSGDIDTDGSLSCTLTGVDVDDSGLATVWASAPNGSEGSIWVHHPLETTTLPFTSRATLFTAASTQD